MSEDLKQKQIPGLEGEDNEQVEKVGPLGKKIDVTVVPLLEIDMKNTGFVSLNAYTANYKYNVKQSFPEKVVELIENANVPVRSYKESYDEETGPSKEIIVKPRKRFNVIRH
jgi:hypothetical protein